jgi:hypothetical protein
MHGFGSLDRDPEWAEFVVWREQKRVQAATGMRAVSA